MILTPVRGDAHRLAMAYAVPVDAPFAHPAIATYPERGTRRTLGVGRTLLRDAKGKRLTMQGAFAMDDLPKGTFLGMYAGRFYPEEDSEDEDAQTFPSSHYALHASGFVVVPHPPVTPERYPMAMLNEPPEGVTASVALVEWPKERDVIPNSTSNERVLCVAMHAARDVRKGEELYFHYGSAYDRRHYPKGVKIGRPAKLARRDVPADERPAAYFASVGLVPPTDSYQ